jgi:hypothetical protein
MIIGSTTTAAPASEQDDQVVFGLIDHPITGSPDAADHPI